MRIIDADALIKEIKQDIADNGLTERFVFYRIEEAPSIDIVRCKECRYWWVDGDNMLCHIHYDPTVPEHFCSYGVKKGATECIPLVRCKDCKWRNRFGCHNPIWGDGWGNYPPPNPSDDDFCSRGERESE